jgi:hypothetical protein
MGYCIEMNCSVSIKKSNKNKLKKLFIELENNASHRRGGRSNGEDHYSWVNNGFSKLPAIEAFEEWRYTATEDGEYLTIEHFTGEKLGDDEILWKTLAPIIEDGSKIFCDGEDGAHWLWEFKNGQMKEKFGRVVYDTEEEKPLNKKSNKNPYEVLGIKSTASELEIKSAWKAAVSLYHPDKVTHLGPELISLAKQKTAEFNQAKADCLKKLKK